MSRDLVLALLHTPPSQHGLNRSWWGCLEHAQHQRCGAWSRLSLQAGPRCPRLRPV